MRLDLIGPQKKALSVAICNQESINCFVVESMRGRNQVALAGSPGTAVFSNTSGQMRGCVEFQSKSYFVVGTELLYVAADGTTTSLGTIPGGGMVAMAADRTAVIVVNGTATGYFYNGTTLTAVAMPYAASTVALLDGYALFAGEDDIFFISAVNDVDSFDALDFAKAIKSPDNIVAIAEDHGEVFMIGGKVTEPWQNYGDVDFPFSRNTAGIFERGTCARNSVAKDDNTLFFLGDDYIVYRLNGYTPVRISDDSTDAMIAKVFRNGGAGVLTDAFAFIYTDHGHKFYQLTVPDHFTAVYDIATGQWHTRKHFDFNTHLAVCYVQCYGKHLIGGIDGKIYEMSRNYYSDGDRPLKRVRRSQVFSLEDRLLRWKEIRLIFEFGTTPLITGQGSDPQVAMRFSKDSGITWGNETLLSLGVMGDYMAKAIKRHCGSARSRMVEISVTDPVPFYLVDAYAEIE